MVSVPDDATVFNVEQILALPVQAAEVAAATRTDPELSKLITYLREGWSQPVVPYWRRCDELTLEGDCILWGMRVLHSS